MENEIEKLKAYIEAYKKSGMEMGNEITSLKRQVAGLKGRNKQMSDRITHYKRLCYEGDEINEKRISEIEEKENIIKGLQSQVSKIMVKNKELESDIQAKNELIDEMMFTIKKLQTPWWKKIF